MGVESALPYFSGDTSMLMQDFSHKRQPMALPHHSRGATSRLYLRGRDALTKPVASLIAFFLCLSTLAWLYFRPWSTVLLLDPIHYHSTIRRALNESFPPNLYPELITGLNWLESPNVTIPAHLFQTDKTVTTVAHGETWIHHGFHTTFLNDSQAAQWVEDHFGGSDVARVYHELPLPVMFVRHCSYYEDTALIIRYLGRQICSDIFYF